MQRGAVSVVVGVALVLGVAGCSGAPPAGHAAAPPKGHAGVSPSPSGASKAKLDAWMTQLCTGDKPMWHATIHNLAAHQLPSPARESDRKTVQTFVDGTLTDLEKAQKGLAALGPAPTPEGGTLVTAHRKELGTLHGKFLKYRRDALTFPPTGLSAVYLLSRLDLTQYKGLASDVNGTQLSASYARTRACDPS